MEQGLCFTDFNLKFEPATTWYIFSFNLSGRYFASLCHIRDISITALYHAINHTIKPKHITQHSIALYFNTTSKVCINKYINLIKLSQPQNCPQFSRDLTKWVLFAIHPSVISFHSILMPFGPSLMDNYLIGLCLWRQITSTPAKTTAMDCCCDQ